MAAFLSYGCPSLKTTTVSIAKINMMSFQQESHILLLQGLTRDAMGTGSPAYSS